MLSTKPPPLAERPVMRPRRAWQVAGLLGGVAFLLAAVVLSLAVGAKPLSFGEAWDGLFHADSAAYTVVHEMRLPRTLLGLLAGTALGLAGAVMQALTRNPLADPGLLGINAGASASVVSAISFLGITSFTGYVWFAFAGAGAVAVLLYAVGGGRGATQARLVLAGAALNAALYSCERGATPGHRVPRPDALLDGRLPRRRTGLHRCPRRPVRRGGAGARTAARPPAQRDGDGR